METNTLVYIKGKEHLGIGCISKVFSKHYNVNIGTTDVKKLKRRM